MTSAHGPFTEHCTISKATNLATCRVVHRGSGIESQAEDENVYWSRAMAWRAMAVKMATKIECEVPVDAARIGEL